MDVELGDPGAVVRPEEEAESSQVRELYGLELTLLPRALALALAEPLLLQLAPWRPRLLVQLPSRIPSWWSAAPGRRSRPALKRKVEAGTLHARAPLPAR
jgi:hypothetical protein